jgi:hypothetical protein
MYHLAYLPAPYFELLEGTPWNKHKKKRDVIRVADWEARWGHEQRFSFRKLRSVLTDPLFLVPAGPGTKKRLCAGASNYGLGDARYNGKMKRKAGCRLDSYRESCSRVFIPHYRPGHSPPDSQGIDHLYSKLSYMCRAEL